MRKYCLAVSAALALLLAAGPVLAGRDINERAEMAGGGTLEVNTVAGRVKIEGWERNVIEVTGELGSNSDSLDFEVRGSRAHVRVRGGRGHSDDTELRIKVPGSTSLVVTVVSADLSVKGVRGRLELGAVSGDIDVDVLGGFAEVTTISGDLEIAGNGEPGELDVTLTSGDAEITGIRGNLTLRTVSGDADIEAEELTRVNLQTTSGTVELATSLAAAGTLRGDSVSGDFYIDLCGPIDADFQLETFSGDIYTFADREPVRKGRHGPGSELSFTVGDGSGSIAITTLSGAIELDEC